MKRSFYRDYSSHSRKIYSYGVPDILPIVLISGAFFMIVFLYIYLLF
jgi:hypothetical protein